MTNPFAPNGMGRRPDRAPNSTGGAGASCHRLGRSGRRSFDHRSLVSWTVARLVRKDSSCKALDLFSAALLCASWLLLVLPRSCKLQRMQSCSCNAPVTLLDVATHRILLLQSCTNAPRPNPMFAAFVVNASSFPLLGHYQTLQRTKSYFCDALVTLLDAAIHAIQPLQRLCNATRRCKQILLPMNFVRQTLRSRYSFVKCP